MRNRQTEHRLIFPLIIHQEHRDTELRLSVKVQLFCAARLRLCEECIAYTQHLKQCSPRQAL